jgi:hypothetical protein
VESDLGGIAGQGLDASIARVKIEAGKLFDGLDLSPLQAGLKILEDMLAGDKGKELKASFTELGQSVVDMLKPLQTENGKKALADIFDAAATSAKAVAAVIREIKNEIQVVVNWSQDAGSAVHDIKRGLGIGDDAPLTPFSALSAFAGRALIEPAPLTEDEKGVEAEVAEQQRKRAVEEAKSAGVDISKGYAAGIREGAPMVNEALKDTLGGGIATGKQVLDSNSPSKVFAGMGKDSALGYAQGANDNADVASDAGAGIARRALMAARSSPSVTSAQPGGAASGGPMQISIDLGGVHVQAMPGMTSAAAAEQGDMIMAALEPRMAAIVRRLQRDLTEFGGTTSSRVA